jgi:hypothetical protein
MVGTRPPWDCSTGDYRSKDGCGGIDRFKCPVPVWVGPVHICLAIYLVPVCDDHNPDSILTGVVFYRHT